MGIYIPNMDKPQNAFDCSAKINPEERVCIYTGKVFEETLSLLLDHPCDDCPLIEIEDTEYEWCHDCKEYDQEKHCCHRWTKVIRNTVAELEVHYGKYITKTDQALVIDYPNTDDIKTIIVMDDEGFTRVFVERRSDD